jgi:hypothetical protein
MVGICGWGEPPSDNIRKKSLQKEHPKPTGKHVRRIIIPAHKFTTSPFALSLSKRALRQAQGERVFKGRVNSEA